MGLVLKKYTNATLTFSQRGELFEDENFNMTSDALTVNIPAILEAPSASRNYHQLMVTNNQEADFVGYLQVSELPIGIKLPMVGNVVFTNGQEGAIQVMMQPPSPYFKENELLGIPIQAQWSDQ